MIRYANGVYVGGWLAQHNGGINVLGYAANRFTQRRKAKQRRRKEVSDSSLRLLLDPWRLCVKLLYGSGGAGLSVPRSRLKIDDGNHSGILSAFAARTPINSITPATVRGPLQSQSGRTMSVGWW